MKRVSGCSAGKVTRTIGCKSGPRPPTPSPFRTWGCWRTLSIHYRVQAFNDTEPSAFSNQAAVTTSSLHPPSRLTATAVSSSGIDLSWQDNSINETGFRVQRQRDGWSDWVPVGTTTANATNFSDAGLLPGARYRYRVQAFNQSESSAFSNQAVATTRSVHPPRGLTARAISSSRIDLSWQDNNIHETGFRVQRRQDGASLWLPIGTTTANAHRPFWTWGCCFQAPAIATACRPSTRRNPPSSRTKLRQRPSPGRQPRIPG